MATDSIDSKTKIETGVAIVGGVIAAVGAVTVATVPMIIGAATVAAAGAFRLLKGQKSRDSGSSDRGMDAGQSGTPQQASNKSS